MHFHYFQSTVDVDSSACIINSLLEGDVTIGPKCLVTNCCIHGDVHIGGESFVSGLVVNEIDKVSNPLWPLCYFAQKAPH